MAGRIVTLEVGSTQLRLMETEGNRVVRWASRSLPPGMFEGEVVADPAALSAALRQLIASSGIGVSSVTASVSGLYSLSRVVMVATPLGARASQSAVMEAASEVIPLSQEALYFSWHSIATVEGGHQVLVMGVPRDVIDGEVQALRGAGIRPRALDLKAMAVARAVNREQALVLNVEQASFDVVLLVAGLPEIMRTTAWQPDELSLEERAERLAVALELTVGFHNSHHPRFPLESTTPFFITGQMSTDAALVAGLMARVGYPLETLTPPLEYPAHLPVSQYAVNIGLALKSMAPPQNPGAGAYSLPNLNLLPQIYRPWRPTPRQIGSFMGLVVAASLLFPLYHATNQSMAETTRLRTRLALINAELKRRQAELEKREPPQMAINEYQAIVKMGGGFVEDLRVIRTEANRLGVKISSISHSGTEIAINCWADTYVAFREYVAALEASGRFSSVSRPPEQFYYVKGGLLTVKPKPAP